MPASQACLDEAKDVLTGPDKLLTSIQKQKRYIAKLHSMTPACWLCSTPVSFFEAVDEHYQLGGGDGHPRVFTCPHCNVPLYEAVPFIAGNQPWFWGNPITFDKDVTQATREQIAKAMIDQAARLAAPK